MSDYLSHLAARITGAGNSASQIRPRPMSLFEQQGRSAAAQGATDTGFEEAHPDPVPAALEPQGAASTPPLLWRAAEQMAGSREQWADVQASAPASPLQAERGSTRVDNSPPNGHTVWPDEQQTQHQAHSALQPIEMASQSLSGLQPPEPLYPGPASYQASVPGTGQFAGRLPAHAGAQTMPQETPGPQLGPGLVPAPAALRRYAERESAGLARDRTTEEVASPHDPSPQTPPTIRVTIGRVELRAVMPAPQPIRPAAPAPTSKVSLDDYLRSRNGGAS